MKLIDKATLFGATRELIRGILADPFGMAGREWTYQGLGMVRTTLDAEGIYRLNVWHRGLRIPHISCIHTHPWDLKSYIINGKLMNIRYRKDMGSAFDAVVGPMSMADTISVYPATGMVLGCGAHPNGSQMGEPFDVTLYPQTPEHYGAGDVYTQERDEIHESQYEDGTVSLNVRTNKRTDSSATVFWPRGTEWVDAKQSMPTRGDVRTACRVALDRWNEWPAPTSYTRLESA